MGRYSAYLFIFCFQEANICFNLFKSVHDRHSFVWRLVKSRIKEEDSGLKCFFSIQEIHHNSVTNYYCYVCLVSFSTELMWTNCVFEVSIIKVAKDPTIQPLSSTYLRSGHEDHKAEGKTQTFLFLNNILEFPRPEGRRNPSSKCLLQGFLKVGDPGNILMRCPNHPMWLLWVWRSSSSTPSVSRMLGLEKAQLGCLYLDLILSVAKQHHLMRFWSRLTQLFLQIDGFHHTPILHPSLAISYCYSWTSSYISTSFCGEVSPRPERLDAFFLCLKAIATDRKGTHIKDTAVHTLVGCALKQNRFLNFSLLAWKGQGTALHWCVQIKVVITFCKTVLTLAHFYFVVINQWSTWEQIM